MDQDRLQGAGLVISNLLSCGDLLCSELNGVGGLSLFFTHKAACFKIKGDCDLFVKRLLEGYINKEEKLISVVVEYE